MHGRWHSLSASRAFLLAETDDPTAIYRWVAGWADLIDFEVHPVIEDEQAAPILEQALKDLD